MKMWIQKTKKIIRSNKGETLVESIVSLLVLSILLFAVTTMIQTALRITSASTQTAKGIQDTLNIVIRSEYSDSVPDQITFTASGFGISATHDIILNKDGGIIAFAPPEAPAPPEEQGV